MVWTCPKCNKTWLDVEKSDQCIDCNLVMLPPAQNGEQAKSDDVADVEAQTINKIPNDIQKEYNNIPNRKNLLYWADGRD